MRLFVSFAHVDEVRVVELMKVLAAAGLEPWWDDRLEPGDDWKAELMRQIAACDGFLFVASTDSVESDWCKWELAQAIALSKFIVPVIIRAGTDLPRAISGLQYADASAAADPREVVRLVERLARLRQTVASGAATDRPSPRGFPARFTRPLPKTYRTVGQGFLRPAAPDSYRYQWPRSGQNNPIADGRIVGIDFGTTTSAVAIHHRGTLSLVPNDVGDTSTPSAVAIAEDGRPLVGQRALDFLIRRPERGVLEVKRLFGREMAKELGGPPVLDVDGISYSPVDLAAFVLVKLRTDAETYLGAPVRRAVLAAPAYFEQSQLFDLMHAARLAGLEVMRVVSEPVAACLGVNKGASERHSLTLVYDLGGGTFDVSLVECGDGIFLVQAVNGDTHLGGADFDREVVDYCLGEFNKSEGVDLRDSATALMRLRSEVERVKIELSTVRVTTVNVPFVAFGPSGPIDLSIDVTRTRYNELTHNLVGRTMTLTRTTLDDAGTAVRELDDIVVVGRAARAASVRVALHDLFGDRVRAAPDQVVALGAGAQAAILDGTLKDALLIDTVTNTLRVQLAGGRTVPVIVRHRTIPWIGSVRLRAKRAQQRTILVRILAGESSWADRNLRLADVRVPCQPIEGGQAGVTLTLHVDANSLLSVESGPQGETGLMKTLIGLRGGAVSGPQSTELADLTSEDEDLLPHYADDYRLSPIHEADVTNLPKVQRWLTDAATNRVIAWRARHRETGAQDAREDAQPTQIREWLLANPDRDLPSEIINWAPFGAFDIERELLVDLLEQRLGIDLTPLRYCHSIGCMADRLVLSIRESRQ